LSFRDRLGLSAYYFFTFAAIALVAPFVPLYLRSLGLSLTQIGSFAMASAICGALAQVPVGTLSDRLRRRRPFVAAGAAAVGALYLLFPHARQYPVFIGLYGLIGILNYSSASIAAAMVVDLAKSGRTGASFASLRIWGSLSFVLMLVVATMAPRLLEIRVIFPLISLFYGLAALSAWMVREKEATTPSRASLGGAGKLLKNRDLLLFLFVAFLYTACLMGATGNLSLYLDAMGAKKRFISLAFILSATIEIPFMLKAGQFSDRLGRRPLLVIAYIVLPFRLFCYFLIHNPWLVMPVQLLHGLTFSIITVISLVYMTDLVPEELRATGQGLLSLTQALSTAVGPVLAGWVGDRAGLHALYGVLGVIATFGCLIVLLFVRESLATSPDSTPTGIRRYPWKTLLARPWWRRKPCMQERKG